MSITEPGRTTGTVDTGGGPASPPPALSPHEQLGRAFKATQAAMRRLRGRETHRHCDGISNAQYGLLFSLLDAPAMSSKELAEAADLTAATATQMLDALEAQGLVTRTRSDHDRRVVLTSLTPRGRELCAARRARMEPLWREALSEFSDAELLTAARVITRLGEFFDSMR